MDLFFCLFRAPSSFPPLYPTTSPICLMTIHTERRGRGCRGGTVWNPLLFLPKLKGFFSLLPNIIFLLFILTSFLPSGPFPPLVFIHGCETGSAPAYHSTACDCTSLRSHLFFFFFNGFCHPPEQPLGCACIVRQAAGVLVTRRAGGSVRSPPAAIF